MPGRIGKQVQLLREPVAVTEESPPNATVREHGKAA